MKIEEAQLLLRRIQKKYNQDPHDDWRVLVGRDSSGRLTQLIANSKETWQIKGELVKPTVFAGVGLRLEGIASEDLLGLTEPYFGLRPVEKETVARLLKGGGERLVSDVLSRPRVSATNLTSFDAVVEGPILQAKDPIVPISERQRELEVRLERGLHKLLSKKYPETLYPYG